jgi:hypothetical protein
LTICTSDSDPVQVRLRYRPHPRQRYTAGKLARQISLLRRFVPEKMFDKNLRKELRLMV